jgi:hypothetical protein
MLIVSKKQAFFLKLIAASIDLDLKEGDLLSECFLLSLKNGDLCRRADGNIYK